MQDVDVDFVEAQSIAGQDVRPHQPAIECSGFQDAQRLEARNRNALPHVTRTKLVDRVIPDVRRRQWAPIVPHSMRLLLAQRPAQLTAVRRIFVT